MIPLTIILCAVTIHGQVEVLLILHSKDPKEIISRHFKPAEKQKDITKRTPQDEIWPETSSRSI